MDKPFLNIFYNWGAAGFCVKPDTSFEKKIEEEFRIVVEVVIPRVDLDV
jgi:hypothetical protein